MKLQFKHQKFQADAARAVVDVFAGQPYLTPTYRIDQGRQGVGSAYGSMQGTVTDFTGWRNEPVVPALTDALILEHIQKIQRLNQIKPSTKLEGRDDGYNLTIEMETGVGKTYTYIKTMYELNRAYGWSKFIVVVPSVAIREGVYKTFEMTQDHFAEEYGKKIRFFIYNSKQLTEIDRFAADSAINVMIINSQAFNARGKDARRITMRLDEFRSRRPIDILARTNPILIIDEPQSVEGPQTKENLKQFQPMLTLRYSATHKADSIYNMVYRLDAVEAYNKHLVKKIAVKGITETGTTATNSYVYLESVNCSHRDPTATIQFEVQSKSGPITKKSKIMRERDNLYVQSNGLEEYRNLWVIEHIDGRDNSVHFLNGITIYVGDVVGNVDEDQLRRIQIRETILSHIQRERQLYRKGIKVLSLFFIDEVANYREYDAAGQPKNGKYANMFEEEYADIVGNLQLAIGEDDYIQYLDSIPASKTHAGYFSVDGKGKMINSKLGRRETTSDDVSAYELIMKNKELLLDRDPKRSPVRFIFSHSALREGWDNPNVFQICTLKQSSSEVRKRQEVGRGLRLCVNRDGERMDENVLGNEVHDINVLTVIASESYDSFTRGLQAELSDAVADRPRAVLPELFAGKTVTDMNGNITVISEDMAREIWMDLRVKGYIDRANALTDKYSADKKDGNVQVLDEMKDYAASILQILDAVYDPNALKPEDARKNNVELHFQEDQFAKPEFQALWARINAKSAYTVSFDANELIAKSVSALNGKLRVNNIFFHVETGVMDLIETEKLRSGKSFVKEQAKSYVVSATANASVPYDLIGEIVERTGLTRKDVVAILKGIETPVFNMFKENPEEFIAKASAIINDQKASVIIEHIIYHVLDERYDKEVFSDATIRGKLGVNAIKANRSIYDHVVYDSEKERDFASNLDVRDEVAVYAKLPDGFYIPTPIGKYNPDWAIAFYEGSVKHIYFVAETKGTMQTLLLEDHTSTPEKAKIQCAREHFKAISRGEVEYEVVNSYQELLNLVTK